MSVNTDARTISDTSLTKEYAILEKYFKWNTAHFKKCNLEAIRHSFASEEVKKKITMLLEEIYAV
jgi:adenosine deaminase